MSRDMPQGRGVASVIHMLSNQDGRHVARTMIVLHSNGCAVLSRRWYPDWDSRWGNVPGSGLRVPYRG